MIRWGGEKPTLRITRKLFRALDDQAGVIEHRRGALERVEFVLADWLATRRRRAEVEQRMEAVSDELELIALVTSIPGLSAIGAAAILAETGDPHRFTSARALVKHAGVAPRERSSGTFVGRRRVTGQGRPSLRLAAWRGIWGTLHSGPVHAARYTHLTTREHNRFKPTQAQAAVAAALLRQLHAIIVSGRRWDPDVATFGSRRRPLELAA
ncbi:transposase [Paenibacillus sp. TRM 82003]|uniref:transposase n=1 Tax=Kineococcus sp. TRM81007 TaxID=2925831 RepID=UPI001F596B35|nr:transposase [Kineococcus sp. TRM81007]MCI2237776.1 transposase [Kineococcus sp. TRM81007]MCI3921795.1 transposase [Paenibacillus sp. TRM 82003]